MVNNLNPEDLRSMIRRDRRYQRAESLLKGTWASLDFQEPFESSRIQMIDINFAKRLVHADAVRQVVYRFDTFSDTQAFIQKFGSHLSHDVIKQLKEPFL
ncbi:MAG: hypothetical protein ACTMH7_03285 [Leuconostoc fallax]